MSDPHDNSIPVLSEILVPGNPVQARHPSNDTAVPTEHSVTNDGAPREPGFRTEPVFERTHEQAHEPSLAADPEPELAPQPLLTPEHLASPEPVLAPDTLHAHELAADQEPATEPPPLPTLDEVLELGRVPATEPVHAPAHAVDHHPKKRSRAHHHAHDDVPERDAGVFNRVEPLAPFEAGASVPPDIAHQTTAAAQPTLDADLIAERLRGRFAGFLTGEGRGVIEARCRDALQEHTGWLVSQITREVALTLETEMTAWVREAVEEEIARRSGHA
ncbi:DUF2486 family protein [Paraburkholderia bryophila]|uniref:Uncharacterized protein DUF2486 n=1 Tax=Paraburkholderia bryophila TaxID=420952 RepID=A0A329CPH0_9BURK|nr:DUF2486 family protein [Paraburkholderia bryophila]RAS36027.1 uncharacterized protein DUF2486 [Paraburkholderia bryophila]